MTHPYNLPDPEGQAARGAAKPMVPQGFCRAMRRDGQFTFTIEGDDGTCKCKRPVCKYDIIAAVDAEGRVVRTADGPVGTNFASSFAATVARFDDLPVAARADYERTKAYAATRKEVMPDETTAIPTQPVTEPGVTAGAVRALEWAKHPTTEIWRAFTPIGEYKAFGVWPKPSWDFDSATSVSDKISRSAATITEAKAAAQADYEARILSALATGARVVTAEQLREWADRWEQLLEQSSVSIGYARAQARYIAAMRQIAGEKE